ncbi:MAG TPA: BrnT family toxin [Bryobacteraceae bacterium]|nr:BrnT family toxin [Bryobacteraceae bacterium]
MAALVFEDELHVVRPDRIDELGQPRWHAIGAARMETGASIILVVAHGYREDWSGEEIIRIISARKAEKHELRRYQEQEVE